MAFNLMEAAGFGKLISNLDIRKITQISLDLLDENQNNFFTVDDVQDLKDSMAINGILQPLLVVPAGNRYRVIAGHRRRKAAMELAAEGKPGFSTVPCVVLPEMSEAMEETALIQTNTTARELSYPEKMEAAKRLKRTLVRLKEEGVEIPGKLRDIVAEQLEISRTELARMQVIEKNLIPEGKALLSERKLAPSVAYAIAKADPACQKEIIDRGFYRRGAACVEEYAAAWSCDWIERDCPCPDGFWQHEEKRKGHPLQCPAWERIKKHKTKGHSERCCGCCARCSLYASGYHCPDVCPNHKAFVSAQNADNARALQAKEIQDRQMAAKEHFKATPFANIGKVLVPMVEEGGVSMDVIADRWALCLGDLDGEYASDYDGGHVSSMIYSEQLDDVNYDLVAFVAFCRAVGHSPDELLGFSDFSRSGWTRFDEQRPPNGARVTVRRAVAGTTLVGEYLFRDGKWFNPALDDFEMNVTNVTHWILAP